ncbi:ATP-binding protein [Streptomyces sp. NBC_00286]|uniref:ATP-binding protein n=1 Tax=Streptomyces sp. NBC_00286 TaxID=2975701 RepID=UPI002E297BD6|nr:ATP-binding protein [Streptomyces sp. NBC_00286]
MAAVAGVLAAVGAGMANEAGKRTWESAGALVRRIAGREVAAPESPAEVDAVARLVSEGLRNDPRLARAWTTFADGVQGQGPGKAAGRPRLPASIRSFTDRRKALKQLDEEARRKADGRPRLALLHGPEGMGVTTLARHWGVLRAGEFFPDGQMYVDLRGGGSGTALDAARALGELLRQLGLPDQQLPPGFTERQQVFQRYVSDRRLLVILDHAQSATQILPVISSAPEVFTLVGARNPLVGLDALRIPWARSANATPSGCSPPWWTSPCPAPGTRCSQPLSVANPMGQYGQLT